MNKIYDLNNGYINNFIVITTHDTFSSENFMNIINQSRGGILLIADEVHGLGSSERRKGLIEKYNSRIGLTATPKRWLDDEGTKILSDYFRDTIFEFPLKMAIPKYLSEYEYYPYFVELTEDELEEYKGMSRKIGMQYQAAKTNKEKQKLYELYSILRQRIVVNAQEKLGKFEEIITSLGNFSHCLIYCSPAQINSVQGILNDHEILQHKFTAEENQKERNHLLESFANGKYKALVAMKCLDEGVDVPPTEIAIVLASSGNPKEFIQRRGRILRKYPGKKKATIYDLVVIPTLTGPIDKNYYELERKIIKKELKRYKEFADASMNPSYTLNLIYPVLQRYKIDMEAI